MLGSPTRSLEEIYDRLGSLSFTAEFKYDGQRAQIHAIREANDITVKIFSRHLEDMTSKVDFPNSSSKIQSQLFHIVSRRHQGGDDHTSRHSRFDFIYYGY